MGGDKEWRKDDWRGREQWRVREQSERERERALAGWGLWLPLLTAIDFL